MRGKHRGTPPPTHRYNEWEIAFVVAILATALLVSIFILT